jgi:23S rRNA C2498 (ribose-2'-O)-methylase RlmM
MIVKKLLLGLLLWGVNCQIFATEVFVIAHSISTRAEARKVIQKKGWIENTNSEQAKGILVVCRSGLSYPLNSSYKNIKELNEDANMQYYRLQLSYLHLSYEWKQNCHRRPTYLLPSGRLIRVSK